MKDLLIGAADLYDWSKIKVWATSARQSGFTGDIVLLTYRVAPDVVEHASKLGVDVYQIEHNSFGGPIPHNDKGRDTQAHQLRFFHMWQFLSTDDKYKEYDRIITTDVRDVWFQKNPSDWLDIHRGILHKSPLVASSEGIKYKDEPWGADNMINGFGPLVWEVAKEWTIYNVGVVAGQSFAMMGLFLALYHMTTGRYIPSDQSAYNILTNQTMATQFMNTMHIDNWACQCGTVLDPQKSYLELSDQRPIVLPDGHVINPNGEEYHIVHQYDRVPKILSLVESLYG